MPRVTLDLRDVRGNHIEDPRVLVRFVNVASGHAVMFDLAFAAAPVHIDAPLAPGSFYRVEITPATFSSALRGLAAVDDELELKATLTHRASEWVAAFTPWDSLSAAFAPLQDLLHGSPRFRVGRVTAPVTFVDAEYDRVSEQDESRMLAKASLLNMYALLTGEPRPGRDRGHWFDGLQELFLATRERIIARIGERDATLIERIREGAHSSRYAPAPATHHAVNFAEIEGFAFDRRKLLSVKTKDRFGNIHLTIARGTLNGSPAVLLDADCDENGIVFAHLLDLPKHAVTGGTHPIEIHDILVYRDPARDLGYRLVPKSSPDAVFAAQVRARIRDLHALSETVVTPVRNIAVIGDSVTWGQGLREVQKIHMLVRDALADGGAVLARTIAHSGAVIGVGMAPAPAAPVHGEVPRGRPTILEQVAMLERPDAVDLLILNGGINDLDIRYILNPTTSVQELTDDTQRVCGVEMRILLEDVCTRVTNPDARIVVLSYFPILSADSRAGRREEFFDLMGIARPMGEDRIATHLAFWDRVVENCATFYSVSSAAMRGAIAAVNAGAGHGRVRFAAPAFKPENAALASTPWLFGLTRSFGPEDPVREERRLACDRFEPDIFRRLQCRRASAGHPNERGAAEFALAVLECLN